jgi:hypothetical protein
VVGPANRRWVRTVMSPDDSTDLFGLLVHDGEMEWILSGGVSEGEFIVVLWMVKELCFSVRFGRDVS